MFLAKNVNKQVHSLATDGKLTVAKKQWLFNVNEVIAKSNEWVIANTYCLTVSNNDW